MRRDDGFTVTVDGVAEPRRYANNLFTHSCVSLVGACALQRK